MPELAEVEYYRKQWDAGIGGTVLRVQTHPKVRLFREARARDVVAALTGRQLRGSRAHGKQLLMEFSPGAWLALHLGMTGSLRTAVAGHEAGPHDHLVLSLERVALVFTDPRQFGKIRLDLVEGSDPPQWWRDLPPQPLERGFTKEAVGHFLKRFPRTPLKTLLLDQRGFPGIGNWMADEICWRLRVPPQRPAGSLDEAEIARLWREVRHVCRVALETVGKDWSDPPSHWLMTHRWRDGGHCPRAGCHRPLRRASLRGRTTCWCPHCQTLA